MKRILFFVVLISAAQAFAGVPYNGWWQKANSFYQKGQFDSALACYQQLAALRPANPEVYYNLGNTYYKLNKIGPAVLNYERALLLKPSYKEALDNLAITRSRISNRIPETQDIFFLQWWRSLTRPALSGTWAVTALVLFLATLYLLGLRRWKRRRIPAQFLLLTSLLTLAAMFIAYAAANRSARHEQAVVMVPDAPLQSSANAATVQNLVPEGTVVKLISLKEELIEVKLPDGRRGWMPASSLEKI